MLWRQYTIKFWMFPTKLLNLKTIYLHRDRYVYLYYSRNKGLIVGSVNIHHPTVSKTKEQIQWILTTTILQKFHDCISTTVFFSVFLKHANILTPDWDKFPFFTVTCIIVLIPVKKLKFLRSKLVQSQFLS